MKYGFDAFARLQDQEGFETVFTWNVNYNDAQEGVARLRHHRNGDREKGRPGVRVDRIELGNELFFRDQRAGRTRTTLRRDPVTEKATETRDEFLRRESRQIANVLRENYEALKAADPTLQISVPVSWRMTGPESERFEAHIPYNDAIARDQSFYDAVSLHRYLRPEVKKGENIKGKREVLDARRTYLETARGVRARFPGKPIWLSEFAISFGNNAISALGLADTYLGFINNPDLIESAQYFQANGTTNLLNFDSGTFTKTTLGATFDTLREAFEDSELLESRVDSTKLEGTLDSVTAEVSQKDGEVLVYAINKSPHEADFNLEFNGVAFDGQHELRTFEFETVDEFPDFRLNESAFKNPTTGTGSVAKLPGLSMSLISIDRSQLRQGNGNRRPQQQGNGNRGSQQGNGSRGPSQQANGPRRSPQQRTGARG